MATLKLALAPMAGLTHEALRLLIHIYGDPDEYFSEMIHAPSFIHGGKFEAWYVRTAPVPEKMVWQLTGYSITPMVKAAQMLQGYGGIGLDINMGCSAPDIVKSGAGAAWMNKPLEEVAHLVRSVRTQVKGRLSVKCRLGETEDYSRLLEFARMLVNEGVNLISLHPRTRSQGYNRPAKRQYVIQLARDLPIPVYGNGDIDTEKSAMAFLNFENEDKPQRQKQNAVAGPVLAGLMVGRAAIQKPWIFAQITTQTARDSSATGQGDSAAQITTQTARDSSATGQGDSAAQIATETAWDSSATETAHCPGIIDHLYNIKFFLEQLQECQPIEFWQTRIRRFFSYYCDNFTFSHYLKTHIYNATKKANPNPDSLSLMIIEIIHIFLKYFEQNKAEQYKKYL